MTRFDSIDLPPLAPLRWTHAQAVAFEAARECIGEVMAICSAELHREESQAAPDAGRVQAMRAELARLAAERAALHVHDAERIATVRAACGAWLREHRSRPLGGTRRDAASAPEVDSGVIGQDGLTFGQGHRRGAPPLRSAPASDAAPAAPPRTPG